MSSQRRRGRKREYKIIGKIYYSVCYLQATGGDETSGGLDVAGWLDVWTECR
jgi:hypothetical protein